MIKVNLLRNTGMAQAGDLNLMAASPDVKRAMGIRVLVILLFPFALYIYESISIHQAQRELDEWKAKVATLTAEKAKYGDAAPRIEKASKQKALVEKKLDAIRGIARSRLREVKTLDALQTLIPPRTWIRRVSMDGNLVSLEAFSSSSEGVTEFIRALDSSVFFSKVEPKKTMQETTPAGVVVKKFELEFHIGKND
jgi:Tfp pilus assembly protein PilN